MEKMFEQASKKQLRFKAPVGFITTEDLWNIPLQSNDGLDLDSIAKSLNNELKANDDESFVLKQTQANAETELKFEIVKYIIKERLVDIKTKEQTEINRTKRDKINRIIERKKDAELESMSIEDLEALKE
mgnify:CR=1 FL=1